jgi:hypothetical protein
LPIFPDTRKEAEIRYRVLTTIEAHGDKCPTTTISEGALHGNDRAFERLLGQNGIFVRTKIVFVSSENEVVYFGRTETGKQMQEVLKWWLALDQHTGGEGWKK